MSLKMPPRPLSLSGDPFFRLLRENRTKYLHRGSKIAPSLPRFRDEARRPRAVQQLAQPTDPRRQRGGDGDAGALSSAPLLPGRSSSPDFHSVQAHPQPCPWVSALHLTSVPPGPGLLPDILRGPLDTMSQSVERRLWRVSSRNLCLCWPLPRARVTPLCLRPQSQLCH